MDARKVRKICRPIRLTVGIALIVAGVITGIKWFYLGIIPLIAGIVNFCPLCGITKQCPLIGNDDKQRDDNEA